jgi:predicted anti-sigma-YlaC factor YlaD
MTMGQFLSSDCDLIRGHVSAALDGELSEVDSARLQAHLGVCADCRAYSAGAGTTARLLRAAPLEELDFPIALPNRRLAMARRLQVTAAAAALVATLGLSAVVGTLGTGGTPRAAASGTNAGTLRSTEDELRMLARASSARKADVHARLAL